MKRGFTLLEVMIAVFLLTVGITGIFVVITKTISQMINYPDKLIAAYLAQEGIEIVRNIRDTNWIEGALTWDEDLSPGSYRADYDDNELTPWTSTIPLSIDTNGLYSYNVTNYSKFYRKIWISQIVIPGEPVGDYALKVLVDVWWIKKGKQENIKAQENLYNWH